MAVVTNIQEHQSPKNVVPIASLAIKKAHELEKVAAERLRYKMTLVVGMPHKEIQACYYVYFVLGISQTGFALRTYYIRRTVFDIAAEHFRQNHSPSKHRFIDHQDVRIAGMELEAYITKYEIDPKYFQLVIDVLK
jgi:hypothetical protein